MGHWVSVICAVLLLLLHHGAEAAGLDIASPSTGNFLTGDDVNLTISYKTNHIAAVKWVINGTTVVICGVGAPNVLESYRSRLTIIGNGSLLINSTTKADAGNYTVTVSMLGEQDGVREFKVRFYDPVIDVEVWQTPDSVSEGTPAVNLTCGAKSGMDKVSWTKDGRSVGRHDGVVLLNENQTLQIDHPNRTSTGSYLCNVSNPVAWNYTSYMLNVSYHDNPATLSGGAIAGIVIGSVFAAILLIALIAMLTLCAQNRHIETGKKKAPKGAHHKEAIRTISGATLSPDDPAFFTLNNIMYRSSSISMGSYNMNFNDFDSENNNSPSPNPASAPSRIKRATQV